MRYSSSYLIALKKKINKELLARYRANIRLQKNRQRQRCSLCCRLWEGNNKTCSNCGVIS